MLQLQGPLFEPEQGLLLVWSFVFSPNVWVSFHPVLFHFQHLHATLSVGVNVCVHGAMQYTDIPYTDIHAVYTPYTPQICHDPDPGMVTEYE